jgi:prepilin peptidase CpaA
MNAAVVGILAGAGIVSAAIDLRTRRIPNVLTMILAGAGLTMAATRASGVTPAGALFGAFIGFALMMPGHLLGATGAGDVKLFAASGTLLGPAGMVAAFVYTAIAGGVVASAAVLRRRRQRAAGRAIDNYIAYAPAIAVGTVVAALGF